MINSLLRLCEIELWENNIVVCMIPEKTGLYLDSNLTLNQLMSIELLCKCKHSVLNSCPVIRPTQLLNSENWRVM